MKPKTAIVCVTNDLYTDQRVHKTCLTLLKCGYFVIEYGRLLPNSKPLHRTYFIERKKHRFLNGPLFYLEYNLRLFFYLLLSHADLIIANDADTLPAAFYAAKIKRVRLLFDAHELFPEVPELTHRPFVKRIWQAIDNYFIPKISESFTVCKSIADHYNQKYHTDMKVVRNIPHHRPLSITNKLHYPDKKIIVYQGAINIGRGIEWAIRAMKHIDNAVLVIIGDGDIKKEMMELSQKERLTDKVFFLGRIRAEELAEYTACADLGLCLLENRGLNYYYSLPNRVFDFIQAGVPIIASPFPEISYVVETYKTGFLTDNNDPETLAKTIIRALEQPVDKAHFKKVASELSWEKEEKILINIITQTPAN